MAGQIGDLRYLMVMPEFDLQLCGKHVSHLTGHQKEYTIALTN